MDGMGDVWGVLHHLQNARYLASMKPFSESEQSDLWSIYIIEGVGCPPVYPPEKIHISPLFSPGPLKR